MTTAITIGLCIIGIVALTLWLLRISYKENEDRDEEEIRFLDKVWRKRFEQKGDFPID